MPELGLGLGLTKFSSKLVPLGAVPDDSYGSDGWWGIVDDGTIWKKEDGEWSPYGSIKIPLIATGDGSAVLTFTFTSTESSTAYAKGDARFYSDSAGTLGESTTYPIVAGSNTLYVKLPSGTANLYFGNGCAITQFGTTVTSFVNQLTNAPILNGFTLSSICSNVTVFRMSTNNHIVSGSLPTTWTLITNFICSGSNTLSGSLPTTWTLLTYFYCTGSNNTLSGSLPTTWTLIEYFLCSGSNSLSGSLPTTWTLLTYFYCTGSNNTLTYTTKYWPSSMRRIYITSLAMTSDMVDQICIDVDYYTTSWTNEKQFYVAGNCSVATSASADARAGIVADGATVTVNL